VPSVAAGGADTVKSLTAYGLDLCRSAGRIAEMTGDDTSLASVASSALVFSRSDSDEAMTLAAELADRVKSSDERDFVERAMSQSRRLHAGERIEGKIRQHPARSSRISRTAYGLAVRSRRPNQTKPHPGDRTRIPVRLSAPSVAVAGCG
jgi:hypothetical protein